jgi:hypothetical protein
MAKAEARRKPVQQCQFLAQKRVGLNEIASAEFVLLSRLEGRLVLRSTRISIAVRSGAAAEGGPARVSGFFRISDFGLRISLTPIPLETAQNLG